MGRMFDVNEVNVLPPRAGVRGLQGQWRGQAPQAGGGGLWWRAMPPGAPPRRV